MLQFIFPHCTVTENQKRKTKESGTDFSILKFWDMDNFETYEIMCFGDSYAVASPLVKGTQCSIVMGFEPATNGAGIRARLDGVGQYGYGAE